MINNIVYLLDRVIGNKGRKLSKLNEYIYFSPFISHYKPKLQVNLKSQKWHCWVSDQGGHSFYQLFKKLNATQQQFDELREIIGEFSYGTYGDETSDTKTSKIQLPKEFKPLWESGTGVVRKHANRYLRKRGITKEDVLKYGIGYSESGLYANRIIIPSYDEDGQLNFFVGRDFYDSKMKYRNSPFPKDIIGFELFINWEEPIVLCEGPMDAITVKRNAIPLFGKTILSKLKKKLIEKKVKAAYIALDSDALEDSIKIIEEFIKNGISTSLIYLLGSDPNELGFDKFMELKRNSEEVRFSDLIKLKLDGKKQKYMEI